MTKNREIRGGKEVIADYDDAGRYITDSAQREMELTAKISGGKAKIDKYNLSGNQKDFQDAILADLDVIKTKLGIV